MTSPLEIQRLTDAPIIPRPHTGRAPASPQNINGPSLIRVPGWVERPLGRYYLYYADHKGSEIKLAFADALEVPRGPGVPSPMADCTIPHIASPEVIVDEKTRTIRLYYHGLNAFITQISRVAVSTDGLHFEPRDEILAPPYLRIFRYRNAWHGLAMPGSLWRSDDGLTGFEPGPVLFEPNMRHAALWLRGETLWVFWTRVGDAPERILL
ncbi:MAG: hypothetical protein QMC73_13950 [Myxococcota bacterium]|jgi:hypothetical protein